MQALLQVGWFAQIQSWYKTECSHEHTSLKAESGGINLKIWQTVYTKIAEEIYSGSLKPQHLHKQLILHTYEQLKTAADDPKQGFRLVEDAGEINPVALKMRQNLFKFSGAKTFAQLLELNNKLSEKAIPFDEFKAFALKLNKQYNLSYLQAEYQTAKQAALHGANWQVYQRDITLYPNLQYKTQKDERVRQEHSILEGIIAPINSAFWQEYYPPNGWRCRCYVVQTAQEPTKEIPSKITQVKPEFKINVGTSGQVFSEGTDGNTPAPYFALAKQGMNADSSLRKAFELSKEYAPYEKVHTAKGGASVQINVFADPNDLKGNLADAILIANRLNISSNIRAHINVNNYKNPEFEIDGVKGDRVNPISKSVKNGVFNAFKNKLGKNGQLGGLKETFLILRMDFELNNSNLNDFASQSWERLKHYQAVNYFILINGEKVVKIDRKAVNKGFDYYHDQVLKIRRGE